MARRKTTPEARLAKLEAEQQKLRDRIARERNKLAAQARKDDTRRKIIAGALALQHKDQAFQATLARLLQEYVTKPHERALFGLEPLPDDQEPPHEHESSSAAEALARAVDPGSDTDHGPAAENDDPPAFHRAAG